MLVKRAISAAAVTTVIAASLTISTTAAAVSGADDYYAAALAAAAAADQAFIDADWSEVTTQADEFDAQRDQLLQILADAQARVDAAADALADATTDVEHAQDALADAEATQDAAEQGLDDANAAFNATVSSVLGAPTWWTQLGDRPTKVSDIEASIVEAQAAVPPAQAGVDAAEAAVNAAQAAYDAATGLAKFQKQLALTAAQLTLTSKQTLLTVATTRVSVLQQAFTTVNGPARKQAVIDAEAALAAAQDATGEAESALAAAEGARDDAQADFDDAQAWLDHVQGLVDGLADAEQSVADRRADLIDLETVKRTVVWTLGADNETPHAGDIVKLSFTVPNSELFALSDAAVRVVTPTGVTPSCDIVGGVVAAGAVVTCTAVYVPTDADALAGSVTFEVELTGYLPLGPGNPRSFAATRTALTVTQSVTVPVAARVAQEATDNGPVGGDAELSDTGLDSAGLAAVAAGLIVAGGALLFVRRRGAAQLI